LAEALERMAAHVETEGLLLEGELLRLGPRRRLRQGDRGAGIVAVPAAAEQRVLPFFAVALVPAAVLDRLVDGREEPRPAGRGETARHRVEGAGLDQALERPLVDQPLIHRLAEREERVDAPQLLADAEHRED